MTAGVFTAEIAANDYAVLTDHFNTVACISPNLVGSVKTVTV